MYTCRSIFVSVDSDPPSGISGARDQRTDQLQPPLPNHGRRADCGGDYAGRHHRGANFINVYIYIHIYIYICMYVYIYIYIYSAD